MSKTKTISRAQKLDVVKRAQSVCPGSMSSVQYDAFCKHFAGKQVAKTLKLKSNKQALAFAQQLERPDKSQRLAASIACDAIATELGIQRNKFWSRKLYAFVAAHTGQIK